MPAGKGAVRLAMILAVAASGLGQSEDEPYFALSSSRTFASHAKPFVSMSSWNVNAVEFRVYRVHDPVQFFQQIEDPHRFGEQSPAPPRGLTWLERIHSWKRSLRAGIRRSLRAQFTESPSAHFESALAGGAAPAANGPKGTHFAEAPLLNSQQMVLSFYQPIKSHARWEEETIPIGIADKGVYLVEAVYGQLRAYTLLIVSDMVMVTKHDNRRIVNLLLDRSGGQPLRGVKVDSMVRDESIEEVESDSNGMAELRQPSSPGKDLRLVAHRGQDFAVASIDAGMLNNQAGQWTGYVYTDRPIYRPGHTVHFKAILRVHSNAGYQVPAGQSVSVVIQDTDQKAVYHKTLATSATGTIHDDIPLPTDASLGYYSIQLKAGEDQMDGDFEVQEYKKPEYEVRVQAAKPRVIQGDSASVGFDARYYFGEPVAGAKVKYAIYRTRYWLPIWYDPDEDTNEDTAGSDADDDSGDQTAEQDGQLDVDGKLTINLPTTVSDHKYDYRYRIEARVTDAGNREVTGKGYVLATYGSFAVNVQPNRYFYEPGAHGSFQIGARDYDSKPVQTRVHVALMRRGKRKSDSPETIAATDVDLKPDGAGTANLDLPAAGGAYQVRVTAKTPEGREVEDDSWLWVEGGGGWQTASGDDRGVQIVADKKSYAAGDTAKLLIVTGQPDTAVYISVEGRTLRDCKLLRSTGATVTYEVPVGASDEPGITIAASFVRKGAFYNGVKYINVPPVDHRLNVKLDTDRPQYLPGQTAQYNIQVTGPDGQPVPRAEFSLGVVDEAIYGLRPDTTRDPVAYFFEREWNRVNSDISLEYYFNGEAGKRRMRLAELRRPTRLAQLKPDRLVLPKIRKAFPDTAFWAADITTDAGGRAQAKVEFPDSLTTWRATARGATPDTKVGAASLKTIVRKNLILRLVVPRFFVQGDEIVISALVHNYLANTKTACVSLDLKGLEVLDGSTRDVEIPSRGEVKLDWRVRPAAVASASIVGKALTDEESDAMELDLPVEVPGVKLTGARGGTVAPGGTAAFDLAFPEQIRPGSRRLTIHLSPSLVGALFGALDYLTSFPYGCVEQTMSSFLPNVVVRQSLRDLGLSVDVNRESLDEKIRAGLDRLSEFEHEDGGWGWWQTDESHPFMTAYVVAGLAQARAAGVEVKDDAVQKGSDWLRKDLAADPKLAGDLRAYMAYALAAAGQADPAVLNGLDANRARLSPYGLAVLGLALELTNSPHAADVAAALETSAKQDGEQAWWPATRDDMLDFSDDATPEATAYAVKLLAHQRPSSPLLPKAALWLMNHRNEGYWWNSTKQTAMVIYGLSDYLKASHELTPNLTATVEVNGQAVLTQKIDRLTGPNGVEAGPEIALDEAKLQPGGNHIRVSATGQGRLYYSARTEAYSTAGRFQKTGTVSLNLLRDYFRLVQTRQGDQIVYDTVPLAGPAAVGDILAVRLTVTGSEWRYLMIEDPIPSGTEFIERDSVYQLRNRPPWWEYWFTRRELHDDRLAIFQTYFAEGQRDYFYLLKVVNPGAFQVSPARVSPMYQPGVMSTSESRRLEVK